MGGGLVSKEQVLLAVASVPEADRQELDPFVVCFGLNTDEVLENGSLPANVPTDYPALCDWLESDLVRRVHEAFESVFFYPEASQRTGETLSVRLAFIDPDLEALDAMDTSWWNVLEIEYYSRLYGVSYAGSS
jgi:hypothetical protein